MRDHLHHLGVLLVGVRPGAIWFRFDPIRARQRVRSRSSSVCATVQVRTRPTDRRTRSESDNPTEWALACHSARSASLARIFTQASLPAPMMDQRGHLNRMLRLALPS